MTMFENKTQINQADIEVMEALGFYQEGAPTPGVVTADYLQDAKAQQSIDKYIKYMPVIDPSKINAFAIFELSGSPCIYFTSFLESEPSTAQISSLHQLSWNHGLAPMLWVITPTTVRLYNCYSKPTFDGWTDPDKYLIDVFEKTASGLEELNNLAGRIQIETGNFWNQKQSRPIDRSQRVDSALLEDLKDTENQLVQAGLDPVVAHGLLGRSIFVSYLQDRGILDPGFLEQQFGGKTFVEILKSKESTYKLFEWIYMTFNGDLFPMTSIGPRKLDEKHEVDEINHLKIVQNLFSGIRVKDGQMRIWPYKFDVIPVELISSVYEMFSHSGNEKGAREDSMHYTPINLVELVLSHVFEKIPSNANVLDLSCGSGVFLVESLRRLVARRISNGEARSRAVVRDTLYNQIYGVDINKEAVQIAAFSLYLTTLELDPDPQPISELRFQPLIGTNLFVADAFDEQSLFNKHIPFSTRKFGAIVGNPPWTINKSNRSAVLYCKKKGYPISRENPAQAFLWRIGDFSNNNTIIGLLMPSKPFFSHTQAARDAKRDLMMRFKPLILMNLSELRKEKLFPTADAPAIMLIVEGRRYEPGDTFKFVRVERTDSFKRHGIIEIYPENVKNITVEKAAFDKDALKVASWGSARDMVLIQKLRDSHPALSNLIEQYGWKSGQGFKFGNIEVPELQGKKWLSSGNMPFYEVDSSTLPIFPNRGLHRRTDPQIFLGPLLIVARGLGKKLIRSAFSQDDIVYDSLYFGISFQKENASWAHFLNAIINSSLATYFLFLTASVWGIERDEIQPVDLLRLPIVLPHEGNKEVFEKMLRIEHLIREKNAEKDISELKQELDQTVFEYYGLSSSEQTLVRDTIKITINLKMNRSKSSALSRVDIREVENYALRVIDVVEPFIKSGAGKSVVAEVFDVGRKSMLSVVKFSKVGYSGENQRVKVTSKSSLDLILNRISKELNQRISDKIYIRRTLRIYVNDDDMYIVKPSRKRYWSQSSGLIDGDSIVAEHEGR